MRASLAVALREYNGRTSQYRHFDAGVRIIFNYSEGLRDVRIDAPCTRRTPPWNCCTPCYFHLA